MTERYLFDAPADWANSLDDNEVLNTIQNTAFSARQFDDGKDFCYYINRTYYTTDDQFGDYVLMIYSLSQPATLEVASMLELMVEKEEFYKIHRISVIRDGVLIDKISSTTVKLLDVDNPQTNRIQADTKKISLNIRDLHLGDILVFENTRCRHIVETDFLRKEFDRFVWSSPDNYWGYGEYNLRVVNERSKPLEYKKAFFRDAAGVVLPEEGGTLEQGDEFHMKLVDYVSITDQSRTVFPFIDFATKSTWENLSGFIAPIYTEIVNADKLEDFAPDLITKIEAQPNLDEKIQFIIEYVQNNIYYIFNSDEMDGHKPQLARVTYLNKQGDCKAKTVLLKVLLDYLGVESSIILVNYNNDFFISHYQPSLFAFDHVITQIKYNNKLYHVDPTQRDQYGLLDNRGSLYFKNYLEIKEGATLSVKPPFEEGGFSLEEQVSFHIEKNKGTLKITSLSRFGRANYIRQYFKRTNKQEILDSWNQFLFVAMNYNVDRAHTDPRHVYKNATIKVAQDDKKQNEITVVYEAEIDSPYFRDKNTNLMIYYDGNISKSAVRDYNHQDVPFWHAYDREKYEISLFTDKKINTQDPYTINECTLDNKYFKYVLQKEIVKNGATARIEYRPQGNIEVPFSDLDNLKSEYQIIGDSNYGVGVEVLELNLFDRLMNSFKGG